jgi:hypothetical protein
MTAVFVVCAAVGGTILAIQFLMALVGLGGHMFDVDLPTDVGHDFDLGGDFHGDMGGDFHGDTGEFHGEHPGDGGDAEHAGHAAAHGSTVLFRILSLRTIVAALTFFGLAGLAAQSTAASTPTVLAVAVAAGAAAMFAVYWMMQGLQQLRAEGTVRIHRAVGQHGNVYLRVPANRTGSGKIQFNLQNRTMEYLAVTAGPELPTGTKVVVVDVVNPTTLEVQAE